MNTFDFYSIKFVSDKKRPLMAIKKKLAINGDIQTKKDGFNIYGSKKFPRLSYSITYRYVEANQQEYFETLASEATIIAKEFNVKNYVQYHSRD